MAELGIAASILQIATFGLKLYHELYKYADSNRSAGQRLKDIAQDVKFTSHIVRELRSVFDESRDIISKDAEKTAREVLDECQGIFDRMKEALDKCTGRRARWTFPFREETFELLRTNLDRLKSTLQLLMQVLTHAQQLSSSCVTMVEERPSVANVLTLAAENKAGKKCSRSERRSSC